MKKFIISSDVLKKVLAKLSYAVAKSPVLPALANIHCKVLEDYIEFTATDLEVTIVYRLGRDTAGECFEFMLPFQLIHKIVGFNKNIPLTFSEEKKGIKITGDNDVYELKTPVKVEDFPKTPEVPKEKHLYLKDEVLQLLVNALETVSKDESKLQLTKVLLEVRPDQFTVASTDGSFSVFSYSIPDTSRFEADLLIGDKVIRSLEGLKDIKLSWNDKNIVFDTDEVIIIVTQLNMKFANFRAIFPADHPSNLTVDRNELIHALEKCNINSDPFKTTVIELKKKKGKVAFLARDTSYNININVEVDGEYSGPAESLKISSEKMLKLMHQVDFEKIDLAIHENNKAVLFRCADHEGYISLLMPLS